MRQALCAQGQQGGDCAEQGITVISAAAAIKAVPLDYRGPGAASRSPAFHCRLLVEMTVNKYRRPEISGYVDEDDGRPTRSSRDLDRRPRDRGKLSPRPRGHKLCSFVDEASSFPSRVESGRFTRYLHVGEQCRRDFGIPGALYKALKVLKMHYSALERTTQSIKRR